MPEKERKKKLTGLFFGSFNPLHAGHLIIANHLVEWTEMDSIWFVISPQNPLKKKATLLDDHHRLALVTIAIEDDPRFRASNIEFSLPQPSYSINTLTLLQEKYPGHEFALIMGADNLRTFNKWKNHEVILENHRIFVYPRPGIEISPAMDHPNIIYVNAPLMEISSTFIRNAIRQGKCVKYLLPEKVHDYVMDMHFYKKN